MILVNFAVLQLRLALLLERDDNQGHEDVHEEERKNDEVDNVENGHFDAEVLDWPLVLVGGGHRVLQYSGNEVINRLDQVEFPYILRSVDYILRPALASLHSKQCQHGRGHVVVREVLRLPLAFLHHRHFVVFVEAEKVTPGWHNNENK